MGCTICHKNKLRQASKPHKNEALKNIFMQ